MMPNPTEWQVITPTLLEELPTGPGWFEIGNLVRTVLFIGSSPGDLGVAVREALDSPRLVSRSHCVRFEVTDRAEERARERLAEYRRAHAGMPPYAQRSDPLTTLIDPRRPPTRALPLSRPGRKAGPATFLRASPSA